MFLGYRFSWFSWEALKQVMLSLYDCIHAYMHTNNSALYSQCQQGHTVKFWVLLGMLQLRDGPKWSKLQGKYWKSQANSNLIITLRTKHQSHNNCPSADIKEWVLSFLLCRICSVFVWQPSVRLTAQCGLVHAWGMPVKCRAQGVRTFHKNKNHVDFFCSKGCLCEKISYTINYSTI